MAPAQAGTTIWKLDWPVYDGNLGMQRILVETKDRVEFMEYCSTRFVDHFLCHDDFSCL